MKCGRAVGRELELPVPARLQSFEEGISVPRRACSSACQPGFRRQVRVRRALFSAKAGGKTQGAEAAEQAQGCLKGLFLGRTKGSNRIREVKDSARLSRLRRARG